MQPDELRKEVKGAKLAIPSPLVIAGKEAKSARQALDLREKELELEAQRQYSELQKRWSTFIIVCTFAFISFQFIVTLMIGAGILNFEKYKWFLPLVISQNFLQIVGMGVIIIEFLFPKGKKK